MTILILGGGGTGRAIADAVQGAAFLEELDLSRDYTCIVPIVALPPGQPLDAYDEVSWADAAEMPLRGARLVLQSVRRAFAGRGGKVVFVLSKTGLQGQENDVAAAAVTEGIRAMGKSCAIAWASEGITVNFLAVPGTALTDPDRARREVAPMVVLLSQTVGAMTASTVVVDGGELMLP